ncbi:MAG TPA: PP2C family protein-serine/threonine phosphatase [Blastocatellia bacterium]|nr:PP2C family protein-serine/threonine phosphatase [Blastocatellia bacterium]
MKKLLDQVPPRIDNVFNQFAASAQRSANRLRWFFGVLFVLATLWSIGDDSPVGLIYPMLAGLWFGAALGFGLRAKTKLTNNGILALWIDLAILSLGLLLCAWQGVFNTKGWLILLCYFPVLAMSARRYNFLLVVQAASFIIVFYALVSLFAIGSLALPRLLAIGAMTLATLALTQKPRQELVEATQDAVREAYQAGASEKELEMAAFVHAQSFPPSQYNLPGLYVAYKHGVGTATSGDFYTALETARGPVVVVGDLPGSGLNAAMAATQLQRQIAQLVREKETLAEVATELNAHLHHKGQTASCILARWEGTELHYVNAGHLPMIHISKRETEMLPVNAPLLGAEEHATFTEALLSFQKGDLLLLYTDGAYQGLASDRASGASEIMRLADQFSSGEVNTICHRVFDCGLPEYAQPRDDSTVVIVRRQEFAGEAAA